MKTNLLTATSLKVLVMAIILFNNSLKANAQEAPAAFTGYKGNYIYNIFKPASAAHPDGEVTGFRLDRKATNQNTWQTLYQFSTPASFDELQNNYDKAVKQVFEYNPAIAYTVGEVWPIFKRKFNYDSLSVYLTQQPMAMAFNILLVDTSAAKTLSYQYRVVQLKANGTEMGSYTSLPVAASDRFVANKPLKSGRKIIGDLVRMEWRAKLSGELPEVLLVKRSEGLKGAFQRILTSYMITQNGDSVIYTVEDDKLTKDQLYQYTITPVNRFGGGASVISDTLQVAAIDPQLLIPKIFTAKADSVDHSIALNWAFIQPDFVSVVNIFRSTTYEGNYQLIKSTNGYNYVDRDVIAGQKYYYYLVVNDRIGQTTERSIKLYALSQKLTKSEAPVQVTLTSTRQGKVISWNDNATDSRGFYVYRTREVAGELKPITEMIYADPKAKGSYSYTDTATNLSGKIGYAVIAENLSNIRSSFSAVVYTESQGMATSQPTLIDLKRTADGVFVFWRDETAVGLAAGYNIYRKTGTGDYIKINKAPVLPMKTSYKDIVTINDTRLTYKITSINASGIESDFSNEYSTGQTVMVYPPSGLKSFYSADLKRIVLQWQPSQSSVANYELYRYVRGQEPQKIASLAGNVLTFTDQGFDTQQLNYYFIKAIGLNGEISQPSAETYKVNMN